MCHLHLHSKFFTADGELFGEAFFDGDSLNEVNAAESQAIAQLRQLHPDRPPIERMTREVKVIRCEQYKAALAADEQAEEEAREEAHTKLHNIKQDWKGNRQ